MNKLLVLIYFLIITISVTAQENNAADALSRMNNAMNTAQEEFTMQDKYFLGRTVSAHILSRYKLCEKQPELIEYLNFICMALAINSPVPDWYNGYHVMILDTPELNAFSTPGGHIFITRGLIEKTASEDMLAAIIAHELAHIQLNHGTAEIMNTRLVQHLQQEQQRISQSISIETRRQLFSEMVNEIVQSLFTGGYSQLQEFEADILAFNLLASTDYDPQSLIELLQIFERFRRNQIASLNNTHPLPNQRIDNLERTVNTNRIAPNIDLERRNRFYRILERSSN